MFLDHAWKPPSTSYNDFISSLDFNILTAICESLPRLQINITEKKNEHNYEIEYWKGINILKFFLLFGSSVIHFKSLIFFIRKSDFLSNELMCKFMDSGRWHISYSTFERTSISKCGSLSDLSLYRSFTEILSYWFNKCNDFPWKNLQIVRTLIR